jgi:glucoamylase
VWDEANRPQNSLQLGHPAGSATPLVWAHAEYLKLLRSALDGKVFDRVDPVYKRYCEPEGRERVRRNLEIYSHRRPIQKVTAGETLRILDEDRFELVWSTDGWKTSCNTPSSMLGSAGFSVDVRTGPKEGELLWTQHWPETGRWLGYNVVVKIESQVN